MSNLQKLNYTQALNVIEASYLAGITPMLYGYAGIGKSQIAKAFAKHLAERLDKETEVVELFGSILKEGDLTGIPITSTIEIEDGRGGHQDVPVNEYTMHPSIRRLHEIHNSGAIPILFIDEVNRADIAVQQELMQPLLTHAINGIPIPKTTVMIAAGNTESDDDVDYQVNTMNDALKDRFAQIELVADPTVWINWASTMKEGSTETNIHPLVTKFIAANPDLLIYINPDEVTPSPRSWEFVSNSLRGYEEENKSNPSYELMDNVAFFHFVSSTVGGPASTKLRLFVETESDPLVDVDDVFTNVPLSTDIITRIKSDDNTRRNLTGRFLINHLVINAENSAVLSRQNIDNFAAFLNAIPTDLSYGLISEIKERNNKLLDKMFQVPSFAVMITKYNAYIESSTRKKTGARKAKPKAKRAR